MPFTRYPVPPAAPLPLAAGATSVTLPFTEHVGVTNRMFITIVRLPSAGGAAGTARPTVILAAGGGAPVEVPFQEGAVSVRNAANQFVASVRMDPTPDSMAFTQGSNGVYLIEVAIVTPGTLSWTLAIRNEDLVDAHDFTWVVADSEAAAQQPWLDVTTSTVELETLVNRNVTGTLTVTNKGTGPLILTGTTPAVGPNFSLPAFPSAPIPPNGVQNLVVTFTAPAVTTAETNTIALFESDIANGNGDADAGTTAGHSRQFTLTATTRALEVALLLDESGSMAWKPNGDRIPPAAPPSRWSELALAANSFLDLLAVFGNGRGTFGVARFRATDPTNPSTHNIVAPGPITNTMINAQNAISAITPVGWTHMGDGLNRLLTPGANYFSTDATAVNVNQRVILLMSDGASNQGIDPRTFIPPMGTALQDNRIRVYTAGYGVIGADDVDLDLLDAMRAGSYEGGLGSSRVNVDGVSAIDLAQIFRNAIKDNLTPTTSPTDPRGVLGNGVTERRHQVLILPYDTQAVFTLNWNTPDRGRLRLALLTPTCDLITPGTEEAGVTFNEGENYQMYAIDHEYLSRAYGEEETNSGRYGMWTVVVSSEGLYYYDEQEVYEYDVIVDSRLRLTVDPLKRRHYAGEPIELVATLTLDGAPLADAAVTVQLQAPGQSVNNWLALTPVTAAEFARAADTLADDTDINPLTIKAFALKQKGKVFGRFEQNSKIPMHYADGAYHATVTETTTPETYTFLVTATGTTPDGVAYQRVKQLQIYVAVQPAPDFTLLDIDYTQIFDNDIRLNQADIRVHPRDRFGNVVLIDPNLNPVIQVNASAGQFTGPVISNLDGSYSRTLHYAPDERPAVQVGIRGETIIETEPIVPIGGLTYVDRVIDFKLGSEGRRGANRHRDPEAALGDIAGKGAFVSLGGYGVLTVGLKNPESYIVAHAEDDITIFVQRDSDLRRYQVEVLPRGRDQAWVLLGESRGTTQSFGLAASGVKQAVAVRITDLSGRIVDANLEALATPGVSIRGVGLRRVVTRAHWLYEESLRHVRGIEEEDLKILQALGIDLLGELEPCESREPEIDIPRWRRLDLRARVNLALDTADEFVAVAGLEEWPLAKIARYSFESLLEESGAPASAVERLCEQAGAFNLALNQEFLEEVTVGQMAKRRR